MKKVLFLLFILVNFSSLNASIQEGNIDSLLLTWNNTSLSDSVRINGLNAIAEIFVDNNPDSAIYYYELLAEYAKANNYKEEEAWALVSIGEIADYTGMNQKPIHYFERSLTLFTETANTKGQATSQFYIGRIQWLGGKYKEALNSLRKSLALAEDAHDKQIMAKSLDMIAYCYYDQDQYSKALSYVLSSLKISEEISDDNLISWNYNAIGSIYVKQGNIPESLKYYTKALDLSIKLDDKRSESFALTNIGEVYLKSNNYDKAIQFFNKSLEISFKIDAKRSSSFTLTSKAQANQFQGKIKEAMVNYSKSLALAKEVGIRIQEMENLESIGRIHLVMGDLKSGMANCLESLEIAQEIGSLHGQKGACECLYKINKMIGNDHEALVYHEKVMMLNDSLALGEASKKLQQMEFANQVYQDSVETAERERLIEESHKEEVRKKNNARNIIAAVGLVFLLLAAGFYSRWRYVNKSKRIIEKERDRSDTLLLNILPEEIAQELKEKGKADARDFEMVSIIFTDFKGFTEQSAKLSAADLVNEINHCFEAFDGIMEKYGIEKIKTIGDAYMAAGGLPVPTEDSVKNTVMAALEMQSFIEQRKKTNDSKGKPAFEMRVGIHTGPVVAGIVGVKKFQYDIWGDTVNTASRMESSGEVGKVNISQATYELLKDNPQFNFESRGKIEAKGKGEMEMYFVKGMNSTSDDSMEQT